MIEVGTRVRANQFWSRPPSRSITRSLSTDPGLLKQSVGASATFSTTFSYVTSSNGNFPGFVVDDVVQITGTNLNNGYFTVTGVDLVHQAFLTLSPPPKDESSPPGYIIRTA